MSRLKNCPDLNGGHVGLPSVEPHTGQEVAFLVELFCAGQPEAVERILNDYGPIFAARLRKKYGRWLACDLCEQIVLDGVNRARECGGQFYLTKGCFPGWLWTVIRRRAAEVARKPWFQQRRQEVSFSPDTLGFFADASTAHPEEEVDEEMSPADRDAELVGRAMDVLSEVERAILTADMTSADGKAPSGEIGEILGLAASTVRWHRARALAKMKEELLRLGYSPRDSLGGGGGGNTELVRTSRRPRYGLLIEWALFFQHPAHT